jgi:hypothetical protein
VPFPLQNDARGKRRSQKGPDFNLDETVTVQEHHLRFVTVDLSERPQAIRNALHEIVGAVSLSGQTSEE